MNKNTLKFAVLSSALMFSASAMAVGLGVNTGVGVKAEVPGVSLNADAKAKAAKLTPYQRRLAAKEAHRAKMAAK